MASKERPDIIEPTPERRRHGAVAERKPRMGMVMFLDETAFVLDVLIDHRLIRADHFEAGIRYHAAYVAAGRSRSGVSKYGGVFGGGMAESAAIAGRWCRDAERHVKDQVGPNALKTMMTVAGEAVVPTAQHERWVVPLREALGVLAKWRGPGK